MIEEYKSFNSLFTDVYGPRLQEGTSKNADLFESVTENVSASPIKNIGLSKYRPNGSNLKKRKILYEILFHPLQQFLFISSMLYPLGAYPI